MGRPFHGGRWRGQMFLGAKHQASLGNNQETGLTGAKDVQLGRQVGMKHRWGQEMDSAERSHTFVQSDPHTRATTLPPRNPHPPPRPLHQGGINLNLIKGSLWTMQAKQTFGAVR